MSAKASKIVHVSHSAPFAKCFVSPIVAHLKSIGYDCELWIGKGSLDWQQDGNQSEIVFLESDVISNPWRALRRIFGLYLALRKTRPTIVHTHTSRGSLFPLIAAWLAGVPIRIYHNHGFPFLGYQGFLRWVLQTLDSFNCFFATDVLTVSPGNLRAVAASGFASAARVKVLGAGSAVGIDTGEYQAVARDSTTARKARKHFGLEPGAFVFGYVGRPVARKGFHLLLEAWKGSKLEQANAKLLIAGCTPEDCARAAGELPPGVHAVGYISDMPAFYNACDAVVLPSFHEGMSGALLEAAAAQRPLIGSDVPGLDDSIVDGVTGIRIPVGDVVALTNAMRRLVEDPALGERMGVEGRAWIEHNFRRDVVLRQLSQFYAGLLLGAPDASDARLGHMSK